MVKISVIVPNYNHAPYLRARIDSVLNQTRDDFELIILDDASLDDSRNIIDSYKAHPRVSQVIFNKENSGSPFKQWAKGLEFAKGDWIWIAESDDLAEKEFLEKMTELMQSDDSISLAYCDAYINRGIAGQTRLETFASQKNKDSGTDKWDHRYIANGEKELNDTLKWNCTINNISSVLLNRRSVLGSIQKIQSYRYHGDWLLYMMLAQKGNIAYTPDKLNTYRDHQENHSKSLDYLQGTKKECFSILAYLLDQEGITQKKELVSWFIDKYIGFGLVKEKMLYREYKQINKALARRIFLQLLRNKLKLN